MRPYWFCLHLCVALASLPTRAERLVRVAQTADAVYVYQAFTDGVADQALRHQTFERGGGFSFERMTWLKLSFGWMLHRSGFASRPRQERLLRLIIKRAFFDRLLAEAVPTQGACMLQLTRPPARARDASVVYQWDPDRGRTGRRNGRAVLQLGLRNEAVVWYARDAILEVVDVTAVAHALRADSSAPVDPALIPAEVEYPVGPDVAARLGLFGPRHAPDPESAQSEN